MSANLISYYNYNMDPHKILGISAGATRSEIQRAYREKAKKHHPDMGGDLWAFQQVQEAYNSLVDPQAGRSRPGNPGSSNSTPNQKSNPNRSRQNRSSERSSASQHSKESSFRRGGANAAQDSATKKKFGRTGANQAHSKKKPNSGFSIAGWKRLFVGELPLQTETSVFILFNVLDIFFTNVLLRSGAIEANPIANWVFVAYGFHGMMWFKLAIVAAVCVIAQIVALQKPWLARALLLVGSLLVAGVVIHSARLYLLHFY